MGLHHSCGVAVRVRLMSCGLRPLFADNRRVAGAGKSGIACVQNKFFEFY